MQRLSGLGALIALATFAASSHADAPDAEEVAGCGTAPEPPFCSAVRGALMRGGNAIDAHLDGPEGTAHGATSGGYYRGGSDFRKDGQAVGW
jgi:hypothetical protein